MIGRIVLEVLLVLLAAAAAALLIPVRVRIGLDRGELHAKLEYGPLRLTLYPRPEKGPESPKKRKKQARREEKPPEPKKKLSLNADQILYSLETLPPILGRLLRRVGRGLRFAPLKIHLLVAGEDPADTALLYGKLQAALAAGLPAVHRLVRIGDQDIQLFLDFRETRIDCIADVGVSLRGITAARAVLCAGGSAAKWYLGFRKLAAEETGSKAASQAAKGA